MDIFFRRPQATPTVSGLSWTGDNTGTVTPSVDGGGNTISVSFANFTGDNLYVPDQFWPELEQASIDTSTTLTSVRIAECLAANQWTFNYCTGQDNLTITGPSSKTISIQNCEYVNVNVVVGTMASGWLVFVSCTPAADLVCSMPADLDKFTMDGCNYTSCPAVPDSVTWLEILSCAGVTSLPTLPTSLLKLYVHGAGISLVPDLPSGLVELSVGDCASLTALPTIIPNSVTLIDIAGTGIDTIAGVTLSTGLLNFNAGGCGLSTADVGTILAFLDANGLSNGTVDLSGCDAPDSDGLTAKASLEGKGWTVTVSGLAFTTATFAQVAPGSPFISFACETSAPVSGNLHVMVKLNGDPAMDGDENDGWDGTLFSGSDDFSLSPGDSVEVWAEVRDAGTDALIVSSGHTTFTAA